ncbi:MAG: GAF domain-containing sensor histidine kinase [Chloroflexi bacterium]|nr:GAF domain-containing sensor histidine kinase [Chloroflexota bacterium]
MLWSSVQPLFLGITALTGLVLAVLVWVRGTREAWLTRWLAAYFLLTTLLNGFIVWLSVSELSLLFAAAGIFFLTVTFIHLTSAFIPAHVSPGWRRGSLVIAALFLLLALIFPRLMDPQTFLIMLVSLWVVIGGRIVATLSAAYQHTRLQPLHRNRLTFWLLILLSLIISDGLWFTRQYDLALISRWVPLLLMALVGLTYNLPDVRLIVRRVVSYALASGVLALFYLVGLQVLDELFGAFAAYEATYGGLVLVIAAAFLFHPLVKQLQGAAAYLTADSDYDTTGLVRRYSAQISNIVDLQKLEAVAIGLISEGVGLQHGTLFLVDTLPAPANVFEFRSVQSFGPDRLVLGTLSTASPIANHLSQIRQPLTQYDIDMLPQFQKTEPEEKEWLASLGMEVYVPIHIQGQWIGLFGLGPKNSRSRFYGKDLILLSTLGDQTAVALENARLFADLERVNKDLQAAYASLAEANSRLQEVDKLKSAFIGVVSHELRTPFANIGFSLHILERHGTDAWAEGQRDELHSLKQGIQKAKNMVEHLVSFASFLQKQGNLHLSPVDLPDLIETTLHPLRPLAESRHITLQHLNGEHPPVICADQSRLGEAIHHLVQNAIKFTPAGGEVMVRCWPQDDQIHLIVRDTGMGVPAERLPELWDSFTQMADPVKRGTESVGLGLALVKAVVTAHGGEVFAESQEGVGSTFGFMVPIS